MVWRSNVKATLLVTIVMPIESDQTKLTIVSNLIFLRALFRFKTWLLLSSMNFLIFSLFIGKMTCFLEEPLIVMLMYGLGLLLPLMIFYIFLIFFTWRDEKVSLILRTFSVLLAGLDAWAYNFSKFLLSWCIFKTLKYLEIALTSLRDLVEMEEDNLSMLSSLELNKFLFLSV